MTIFPSQPPKIMAQSFEAKMFRLSLEPARTRFSEQSACRIYVRDFKVSAVCLLLIFSHRQRRVWSGGEPLPPERWRVEKSQAPVW